MSWADSEAVERSATANPRLAAACTGRIASVSPCRCDTVMVVMVRWQHQAPALTRRPHVHAATAKPVTDHTDLPGPSAPGAVEIVAVGAR